MIYNFINITDALFFSFHHIFNFNFIFFFQGNRTCHHSTISSATNILLKGAKKSDGSVGSGALSTCKSFSKESADEKQIFENEPFCTMKSPTVIVSKTRQQFGNIGDDNDVIHQSDTIMEKKCSNAQKFDTLLKQKQEIPLEQNHDKEVGNFISFLYEVFLASSQIYSKLWKNTSYLCKTETC
ncbi:unnamed protein product [Brugia pahangi]|uniref:Uncharacterized protein n=1 Tax=Brugia pahangi TaxID=6280 RepID=A0A3P7UHV8_BRUPA|nr:unnamed protein product [Brugia pahangi]